MSVSKDLNTKTWTAQIWYKDFTGKRRHTTKRGFATKREAEKYEREFLCFDRPVDITIGEIAKKFKAKMDMQVISGELQDTTVDKKKGDIDRYILPYFEKTIASKVTTDNINEWIHELITNRKSNRGSRLASGTIKSPKQILSQIFEYGIRNLGLKKNPVTFADKIGFYSEDNRVMWTVEQFTRFHNMISIENPTVSMALDIVFASGLRIGEVLALTPNDITPYKISIVKGVVKRPKAGMVFHKPKTSSSVRDVEIPRALFFRIFNYIDDIPNITGTTRIFNVDDRYCRRWMKRIEKKLGLPHTSPHMLRHLYASTIYAETKDLTIIASQLGHASTDVTAKIYVDLIKGNDRKAVDNLENILTIK